MITFWYYASHAAPYSHIPLKSLPKPPQVDANKNASAAGGDANNNASMVGMNDVAKDDANKV